MSEPKSKKLEERLEAEIEAIRMNCILEDGDGEVTEMAVELGQRSAGFLRDALSALREKDEEIARLHTRMNMLFGYISTLPPWTNKHPEEVKRELLARIEVQP